MSKRMGSNPLDSFYKDIAGKPARRVIEKTSQENLPENWTRATFIIREDRLEKLKDYAYTDRRTLKEIVNEMLDEYLADKEIIERKKSDV